MAFKSSQNTNFFKNLKSLIWKPLDERQGCCPNCSHPYVKGEPYCYHCGEERIKSEKDQSIFVLFGDFLVETITVNQKLPLTLAWLFLNPGKLTRAYYLGVRNKVLRPLTILSVTITFFYAYFSSVTLFRESEKELSQGFYAKSLNSSNILKFDIDKNLEDKSYAINKKASVISQEIEQRSTNFSKSFFWIIWPFWALIILVVLRGTGYHFNYHLVCAAHIFGAYLIGWLLIVTYAFQIKHFAEITQFETLIINLPFIVYVIIYFKNAYKIKIIKALLTGIICSLLFFLVVIVFRQAVTIISFLLISS